MSSPVLVFTPPKKAKSKNHLFSDKQIRSIKPPMSGTIDYTDPTKPGLTLRVSYTGTKTWVFRYASPTSEGRMRRHPLGEFGDRPRLGLADARIEVEKCRAFLREGKDPADIREARRTATTFGALFRQWLTDFAQNRLKGEGEEEARAMTANVLPTWEHRVVDDLTKADLLDLLRPVRKRGANVMANRIRKHISRVISWGVDNDLCTSNPVRGTKPTPEESRDRVLTADEMKRVWEACEALPVHQRVWFRLRLVLGQRGGEIVRMRWADIDGRWWDIPKQHTKNKRPHRVYLPSLAVEQLALLPQRAADGPYDPVWVFPCGPKLITHGKNKGTSDKGTNSAKLNVMGDYKKISRRLAQPSRANICVDVPVRDRRRKTTRLKADFTGHDLRRTMSTTLGVGDDLIGILINHAQRDKASVTAVYNRNQYDDEKQALMEFWDKQLRLILAGDDVKKAGRFSMDPLLVALQGILAREAQNLSPAGRAELEAVQKLGAAS